jgi:hypothetical protein
MLIVSNYVCKLSGILTSIFTGLQSHSSAPAECSPIAENGASPCQMGTFVEWFLF